MSAKAIFETSGKSILARYDMAARSLVYRFAMVQNSEKQTK